MNLILLVFNLLNAFYQVKTEANSYPQNYFISPIDVPISLSGNFGEPRRLHFHTGIDIRTNGEEGHKVFAAAGGYITRINVSGAGYGNALYVKHPNGFVTVYGHLLRFSPRIMERLRKEQYANESFAVDFKLNPNELPVNQGDIIAYSGNTGGSGGPHLHFEIRDSLENIINPALFGYKLKDEIKPTVLYLKFYPFNDLQFKSEGYRTKVFKEEGIYRVTGNLISVNSPEVGIAVNAFDMLNNTENHMGIYSLKLFDNNKLMYEYRMDKISFDEKRYVLSQIDYAVFMNESKRSFYKCFTEPGNMCKVYPNLVNEGILNLVDKKTHAIRIEVGDVAGNISTVELNMKYDESSTLFKEKEFQYTTRFEHEKENVFSNENIRLIIPAGCLFDKVYFNYTATTSSDTTIYSKVHQLDKSSTMSFSWFDISIRAERLKPALYSKAIIVYKDGVAPATPRGGKYENGFVTTRSREFGTYFIKVDNKPPSIAPVNVKPGRNMRAYKKLVFKIWDNLSGVADFDTYIDGKWTVTDYDAKNSRLTHTLDQKLSPGSHTFKVIVTDERKNQSEYSIKFNM